MADKYGHATTVDELFDDNYEKDRDRLCFHNPNICSKEEFERRFPNLVKKKENLDNNEKKIYSQKEFESDLRKFFNLRKTAGAIGSQEYMANQKLRKSHLSKIKEKYELDSEELYQEIERFKHRYN